MFIQLANVIDATFRRKQPVGKLTNNSISWYVVHIVARRLTAAFVSIIMSAAVVYNTWVVGQCLLLSVELVWDNFS